ncbi:UNVERIFIED_CONTAM: hypothetical protein FKN15_030632 [Acipenser sinensis]
MVVGPADTFPLRVPAWAADVRAFPSWAVDARAPTSWAVDARAPPFQSQDIRAPPSGVLEMAGSGPLPRTTLQHSPLDERSALLDALGAPTMLVERECSSDGWAVTSDQKETNKKLLSAPIDLTRPFSGRLGFFRRKNDERPVFCVFLMMSDRVRHWTALTEFR